MNNLNPEEYLRKIHTAKYKRMIFPILLVIISFVLNNFSHFEHTKYLALFGLIWYIFILVQFKVNKAGPIEENNVGSPVAGKVKNIGDSYLEIEKSIFDAVDIHCVCEEDVNIKWKKTPVFWENDCSLPGRLIGYTSGNNTCRIEFSENWKINVQVGQKLLSGDIILQKREDNE